MTSAEAVDGEPLLERLPLGSFALLTLQGRAIPVLPFISTKEKTLQPVLVTTWSGFEFLWWANSYYSVDRINRLPISLLHLSL